MFLHTPSQGVSCPCTFLEIRKKFLHRCSFRRTTDLPHSLCKASRHRILTTVLDREEERPSKAESSLHEHDELYTLAAQVSDRQKSQAGTSTSYGSLRNTGQHPAPPQKRQVCGISSTEDESGQTPSLTGPPRLVRPTRMSTGTPAEQNSSPSLAEADIGSSHGMAIVDRGRAAERVYWRGSVMSREAVLGRMLVRLPAGHSVADVLGGEMLSSKQITRCLPASQLLSQLRPFHSTSSQFS